MDVAAPVAPAHPKLSPASPLEMAKQARLEGVETVAHKAGPLARGKAERADIATRLVAYNDLEARIASESAEMVKRGLPAQPGDVLAAEYEHRAALREQLALCDSAVRVLQAEYDAAVAVLREAEVAVEVEGYKIMLGEADKLAAEIGTAYRRIWELSDSLVGVDVMMLAVFPTLPPTAALQMRAALGQVLEARQPPKRPYVPGIAGEHTRQAVAYWRERHIELVR